MEEYTEEDIEFMKNMLQRIQILEEINKGLKEEQKFLKNQIEMLDNNDFKDIDENLN